MPAATYYLVATIVNEWGETSPSAEVTAVCVQVGNNNAIEVNTSNPLTAGVTLRVYIGLASGAEAAYYSTTTLPFFITDFNTTGSTAIGPAQGGGIPPTRNTAFLPDTDGSFLGAYSAYQLLKRALDEMVRLSNGITDVIGVPSITGTAMYRITTPNANAFFNFTNVWYNGYPMDVVARRQIFLRNVVTGFSGLASFEHDGDAPVVQFWPQTDSTAGATTLSGAMGVADVVANVVNSSSFQLSLGIMLVDSEIMAFSQSSNTQMTGILRGMGGTIPATHNIGAPVVELNIRLSGKRMAPTYKVGQSDLPLRVPPAWDSSLVLHMLSQYRSMEQDEQGAASLLKDFAANVKGISQQSVGPTKPRQVQVGGDGCWGGGHDVYNVNGSGFGWFIM
jgi:hypothetical protein